MGSVLIWYFAVTLIGWITFPIAFVALRHFPDKGYAFSKVLGLLLIGYLYWLLGYVAFNGVTLFLVFILVATVSTFLLMTWIGKPFVEFAKKNLSFFLLMEGFFLMAFIVAGAYKMRTFDIVGTEKPMDFAMINGILASPSMPPQDPWLAGGSISYYYFGYFIVAMLQRLTAGFGVTAGEAYNLAVALTWALAALCAFSLVYALTRRYRYSLFSAACLTVFGNLDYWHRAVQSFTIGSLRVPYYNQPADPGAATGFAGAFGFLLAPLQHGWDYFQASRIVPVPPSDKLINEFPSFSFFLSDLHPHVMAIPFVLLAIAVAYNLLKAPLPGFALFGGQRVWQVGQWVLIALVIGSLSFFNSWDFPTFMFLLGVCLFLQQWWANEKKFAVFAKAVLILGVPIVIAAFAFYAPFFLKFQSQARGLGMVHDRTDLYYLIVIFGAFFTILIPALVGRLVPRSPAPVTRARVKKALDDALECVVCGREGTGKKFCGYCGGELAMAGPSEITPVPHEPSRTFLQELAGTLLSEKKHGQNLITLVVVLVVLVGLNFQPMQTSTILLGLLMAAIALLGLSAKSESREMVFVSLLCAIGFLLILGCEVLFIKDHFSDGELYRMNSVFKFHYQVWILFSLAAGPLLKWLFENAWPRWGGLKKGFWTACFLFTFFGAFLYPVLAFTSRMAGSSPDLATMDGEVYYERAFGTDHAVAQWVRQNVHIINGKVPVILETWGGSYQQQYATVATMTGFPTVLGWDFHEAQWRGSWDHAVVRGQDPDDTLFRRRNDIDAIYTSADLNQTRDLMRRYAVDYVYVSDIERDKYKDHPENLGKFSQLGTVVFQQGSAVLYKINP
jgi:YYY domain-containing protein